jgi:hypothetical protein
MVYLGGAVLAGIMKVILLCTSQFGIEKTSVGKERNKHCRFLMYHYHYIIVLCYLHDLLPIIPGLQDAPEFWITRQEYQEEGVACLSKCGQA